jgi:hypothetical protein
VRGSGKEEPILIRNVGASMPGSPFVETPGIPAAIVPTVNGDDNQHGANGKIRRGNVLVRIAVVPSLPSQRPD